MKDEDTIREDSAEPKPDPAAQAPAATSPAVRDALVFLLEHTIRANRDLTVPARKHIRALETEAGIEADEQPRPANQETQVVATALRTSKRFRRDNAE